MPQHRSQAKVQGVSRVSEEVRGRRGPWVPHERGVDQAFQQQCNNAMRLMETEGRGFLTESARGLKLL